MMPDGGIALLTERRYAGAAAEPGDWYFENILADDRLLIAALAARGLPAVRVDWARPDVDWSRFRAAVFRTTWDYFHRFDEFRAWLRDAESRTRLINAAPTVWWNLDKHYLGDLAARGVPVAPTRFLERGSRETLQQVIEETGWSWAVVKPCVSGSARHTYRFDRDGAAALEPVVAELLAAESLLVQPFLHDIVERGEDTLMVIDGRVTHAVRKKPKRGDFRVQDDHGGTVESLEPVPEQVALAERAMACCEPSPLYGRVDMARDATGSLVVMELELIEPELWLRRHPPAADDLAEAIARTLLTSAGPAQ